MRFLFLDLDDTILDFHKAERIAVSKTFREFGLEPTEAVLQRYHAVNREHWERLERGEITREQTVTGRFGVLFGEMGISVDPAAVAAAYERNLAIGHYFLPGAEEAVKQLSRHYRLYLASNGTASVQHARLDSAGLKPYFQDLFISQEIGWNKPSAEFFDACFARIPDFNRRECMMVGDSQTSDIRGGNNAGLTTCWINPTRAPAKPGIHADYELESLALLPALLAAME